MVTYRQASGRHLCPQMALQVACPGKLKFHHCDAFLCGFDFRCLLKWEHSLLVRTRVAITTFQAIVTLYGHTQGAALLNKFYN